MVIGDLAVSRLRLWPSSGLHADREQEHAASHRVRHDTSCMKARTSSMVIFGALLEPSLLVEVDLAREYPDHSEAVAGSPP